MGRPVGSKSAGYHADLSIPGYKPKTPTVAPPPSEAAKGPAGLYSGAKKEYAQAVTALPPAAQAVTQQATRQAVAKATRQRARATERRAKAIVQLTKPKVRKASQPISPLVAKYTGPKANPGKQKQLETKAYLTPQPTSKPAVFKGKKTAGAPTLAELQKAAKGGTLKTSKKGYAVTPAVHQASKGLRKAKKVVAKTQPKLARLSPAQKEVAHLASAAHRKYPNVPVSVLMGDTQQESNFNAGAVSSAGAQGLTQFIPSTASEYGVKYGTGKPEKRSQVFGQAHLLSDSKKSTGSIATALGDYYGDPSSPYASEVLAKAAAYKPLDKTGSPKALKRLAAAKEQAAEVGLKVDVKSAAAPPKQVVTRYKAGLKAMGELEKAHLPYVWDGGHNAGKVNPGSGLDCSGTVSYVLQHMGVKLPGGIVSGDMGQYLAPGPGAVTVFYNGEHTFMRVGNKYFGTSESNPGGGAGFFPKSVGNSEVASGNASGSYSVGHVPGLGKKQALQLGVKVGSGGSQPFPGMTLSSSGTSASIDPGAGTTQSKPGFSQRPIKLTLGQRVAQTKRKLKALGVGVKAPEETSTTLSALEKKYGHATV